MMHPLEMLESLAYSAKHWLLYIGKETSIGDQ